MGKVSVIILILLLLISQLNLFTFTKKVQAIGETTRCTSPDAGITYLNPTNGTSSSSSPDGRIYFPQNSGKITIEFQINSNNLLNGKKVKLHFPGGVAGSGNYTTSAVTATSPKFSFEIDDNIDQAKKGDHEANLWWDQNNTDEFSDYCSQIKYKVGITGPCIIFNAPQELRPDSIVNIDFLGFANTVYNLNEYRKTQPPSVKYLGTTTTDSNGRGVFENVLPIAGAIGDSLTLRLATQDTRAGNYNSCSTPTIKITATAPPPPPPLPRGPGIPDPDPVPKPSACTNPSKCSSGGGKPIEGCSDSTKPGYDPKNPGIATAIGCIHTNPAELAKDVLTFVIAIGGGLAFLMMLLGAFQMLTSAGNPETLNAGRERLTSAIIGLLFVIFSILLLQIIGAGILNLPGFKP